MAPCGDKQGQWVPYRRAWSPVDLPAGCCTCRLRPRPQVSRWDSDGFGDSGRIKRYSPHGSNGSCPLPFCCMSVSLTVCLSVMEACCADKRHEVK